MFLIVFFTKRKNTYWFNYFALFGEILYLVYINFKIQHYPFNKAIAGALFAIIAFIGSMAALKRKKIQSTFQLGIAVSVYVYIAINLSLGAATSQHIYTSAELDTIFSRLRKNDLPDSTKHYTIIHPKDSIH